MKSQAEVNERKRKAVNLRLRGWTQQMIADELGVDVSVVCDYLKYMGDLSNPITEEEKQEYRKMQLKRIDALLDMTMTKAIEEGNLNAVDRVIKLEERRAKLIGLDEPAKQEVDVSTDTGVKIILGRDCDGF